jgi:hypothetical protein
MQYFLCNIFAMDYFAVIYISGVSLDIHAAERVKFHVYLPVLRKEDFRQKFFNMG